MGRLSRSMPGYINTNREAILQITIVGDNKKLKSIKAVIDTGFTGDLTLPKTAIDLTRISLGAAEAGRSIVL